MGIQAAVGTLLLALCLGAGAEDLIPAGPAPEDRLKLAAGGLTLNAEVLGRYGFDMAEYQGLGLSERQRVTDWIRILERERSEARPAPNGPGEPRASWNASELDAIARIKAETLFDNQRGAGGSTESSWYPSVDLLGGRLRRFSLSRVDRDLRLDAGTIGVDGGSPLVAPSPYANLTLGGQGSGSKVDWSWKAQTGVLRLNARLFAPDAPGIDRRVDGAIDDLDSSAGKFGLGGGVLGRSLDVPTEFEGQTMFVGSVMAQMGRAYRLVGPVDVGWSAMSLMRMTHLFPNSTLDQTAGARVRLPGENSIGLYGGLTEAAGLFSRSVWRESLRDEKFELSPSLQTAPHAGIAAWGKLPYLSQVRYSAEAGRQWNPWTTVTSAAGSLSVPAGREGTLGVQGFWSRESGKDIEFERRRAGGGVSYSPVQGVDLSVRYGRDSAAYGNAGVSNQSVLFGLSVSERGSSRQGKVTMDSLFGGRDQLILPDLQATRFISDLQAALGRLRALKDAAEGRIPGGYGNGWREVQREWNGLDPGTRAMLDSAWTSVVPSAPSLSTMLSADPSAAEGFSKALTVLADPAVLERILVRFLRHKALEEMANTSIPILGKELRLTAPVVIAAAHAYGLSLTPVPPMTERDARQGLDPFMHKKIGEQLGCGDPTGDAKAVSECLLGKAPDAATRERLRRTYGDDLEPLLKEAVSWASDVVRREVNALLLQVFLAAERLNELTVDHGERIGDLNARALTASFSRLDRRSRADVGRVLRLGREDLQAAVAAQDKAMKGRLSDYGGQRLAWLQAQPSWPANVEITVRPEHWAPLLAVYGDDKLFGFILRAKGELARRPGAAGRLLIEFDRNPLLGGVSVIRGDPVVVRLPPKPVDLTSISLVD
ncbi:MAG: hypothetical protein HY927_12560 [Elusimicrobia bacterium]|nr:hypothetical protein [Elusimicrobiota bacterium]